MAHFKKISTTLSVATTVLLQACSSAGSDSAPAPSPVPNTKAPELVSTWQTGCIVTQNSSATTSTTTQASGGSGGSGGVSNGASFKIMADFKQDGHVKFTRENFETSDCNASKLSSFSIYDAVYFIGEASDANDGSLVTEVSYSDSRSTTYSIFQVTNGINLRLGDEAKSTPGNDGSSEAVRLDGLGDEMSKQ
jgi:hypothetical protein